MIAAREEQLAERLLDAPAQHHHVEQHGSGYGDTGERERGAERVATEVAQAPAEPRHALPHSTIGGVRTSRQAARAPAARPNSRERQTLKSTILGVMRLKISSVSKYRR